MYQNVCRAKNKENDGEWVTGYYTRFNGIEHRIYTGYAETDCGDYYPDYASVIPETVGRYTELTDRNGEYIFEGDIVKFAKHIYQIIFECGSFALFDKSGEMISKVGGHNDHCYSLMNLYIECCWEDNSAYDIEVIGNIHDNPELIKGDGK